MQAALARRITEEATMINDQVERIARFIKSHPGFYVSHNEHGVTLQIEVLHTVTRETWIETLSVWSMAGAREALCY